jgi:hypothetical protein
VRLLGSFAVFEENGYILVERLLPDDWSARLRQATEEMVDKSRSITKSDATWDLDKGHTAANPRLRRLSSMNDHHPVYWEYASSKASPLPDAIADLVGPDENSSTQIMGLLSA